MMQGYTIMQKMMQGYTIMQKMMQGYTIMLVYIMYIQVVYLCISSACGGGGGVHVEEGEG